MKITKKMLLKEFKRKKNIYHSDIPDVYKNDIDIIKGERKCGLREIDRVGYDVIRQKYFTYEICNDYGKTYVDKNFFDSFDDYYDYLDGDIYNNACYYQCNFKGATKKINKKRLMTKKCLTEENKKDYEKRNREYIKKCIKEYIMTESIKKDIKKWVNKINKSKSYKELDQNIKQFAKIKKFKELDIIKIKDFFLWQYINKDITNKDRIEIIIEYAAKYDLIRIIFGLCNIFDNKSILSKFKEYYQKNPRNGKARVYRKCSDIKEYILNIQDKEKDDINIGFDERIHYYYVSYNKFRYLYYYNVKDLIKYVDYDLRNADLSRDYYCKYDFKTCKTDNTTKLPLRLDKDITYIIKKEYKNNKFIVTQEWYDYNGSRINGYELEFDFFFDFISFLDNDLSNADLTMCQGLINLNDISKLNLNNAKLLSNVCDKFGIFYSRHKVKVNTKDCFEVTAKNETCTQIELENIRPNIHIENWHRVYYISDIHIDNKLELANVKSEVDKNFVIRKIVDDIIKDIDISDIDVNKTLFIYFGGDITHDFEIYKSFINILKENLDERFRKIKKNIFFTLGNHELWSFPNLSFDKIVKKYRQLLNKNEMHLIQNDILYNDGNYINMINENSLEKISKEELRNILDKSWFVIFGGIGFSAYNEEFNAKKGIYLNTISRKEEITGSKRLENLYNKIVDYVPDKPIMVVTHMPMDCWRKEVEYHNGYIYVSGHTHKNFFSDNREIRIYEDNQIGYWNKSIHLKWFYINNTYDFFYNYKDGIYEITSNDYREFYRGKNQLLTFNRGFKTIYMLKKNGIYCFIVKNDNGNLNILNGGSIKSLKSKDITYYYNNIDHVIDKINMLEPYNEYLEKISNEIKMIGGSGMIHGCIIDIDFFNHIFVSPKTITPYYASDMKNKKIYNNLTSLLKDNCPQLYKKYLKNVKKNKIMILKENNIEDNNHTKIYLETDIYKLSGKVLKMQKIKNGILTIWLDDKEKNKDTNNIIEIEELNTKLIEQKQ